MASGAIDRVVDRTFRSATFTPALVWLYNHNRKAVADALFRSRIAQMDRLATGELHLHLILASEKDEAIITSATMSYTRTEMPGPLDKAFEAALPGGDWPIFTFEIAKRAPAA